MHKVQSESSQAFLEHTEELFKRHQEMLAIARRLSLSLKQPVLKDGKFSSIVMNNVSTRLRSSGAKGKEDGKKGHTKSLKNEDKNCDKEDEYTFPRYPVLSLKETIDKFLKTCVPILDKAEYDRTKEIAEKFLNNEGAQLQSLLEKAAEKEENWLAQRWMKYAYLKYRDPVTVFSSPGMSFPLKTFCTPDDYLTYTSKVIYWLLKYKQMADCDQIPVSKIGNNKLDNSQFKKVFGTCRIPKPCEDRIQYHPDSKHIVIIHKNNFYKFPAYDKNGEILMPQIIFAELKKIIESETRAGIPFGILSTHDRDSFAESYASLESSYENEPSLRAIERSLFTVNLDQPVDRDRETEYNVLAEQLIHGGGSEKNSGNRWMDKTIQLVVNPNGMSGFTYEHTAAEGQPIANIIDFVSKKISEDKCPSEDKKMEFEPYTQLKLKSNPCVDNYIAKAKDNVDKLARELHMKILIYEGYGKDFIKAQKLSPDSYIQMGIQYAFYALHGVPGACYESAHLRIYNGGRTETIRSCSSESVAFAKAMCQKDKNALKLLREAVGGHKKYSQEALMGRGVDRHLSGLKWMAIENKLPIPEFYESSGYIKSAHFRLSTSQVASKEKAFLTYGPLVKDGYGCCYNPRESSMIFAISSWRYNDETCSERFAGALKEAFDNMRVTLCEQQNSKL